MAAAGEEEPAAIGTAAASVVLFVFGSLSPWPLCSTVDLPAPSEICWSVGAEGLSAGLSPGLSDGLSLGLPLGLAPVPVVGAVPAPPPLPPPAPPLSLPKTTSEQV